MSGPLVQTKLTVYQGVDETVRFVFFYSPASGSTDPNDLVAADFTGCAARMMVKAHDDPSNTALLTLSSSAGIAFISDTITPGPAVPTTHNGVDITVTRTQSLALNGGVAFTGYFDILIDWPNSTTSLLMRGAFELAPTVTR